MSPTRGFCEAQLPAEDMGSLQCEVIIADGAPFTGTLYFHTALIGLSRKASQSEPQPLASCLLLWVSGRGWRPHTGAAQQGQQQQQSPAAAIPHTDRSHGRQGPSGALRDKEGETLNEGREQNRHLVRNLVMGCGGRLAFPFADNQTVISCSAPQCLPSLTSSSSTFPSSPFTPIHGLGVGLRAKCEDGPDKQSDWEETPREGDPGGQDVRGRRETVGMEGKNRRTQTG